MGFNFGRQLIAETGPKLTKGRALTQEGLGPSQHKGAFK